jgi:NAD(P)H-dependent flavin oxidoreductase YrpB (nitropropane dioxygenase family)
VFDVGFTPRILKLQLKVLKNNLNHPGLPFGVDLLIPQVGGNARKTNYDYNKGHLEELIEIIISSGARLFVSAVGVPPVHVVQKLHKANILVMNIVGAPKHVPKALSVGVDLICCQGSEGGGHTGSIGTSVLLPKCVDLCRGYRSPLTGLPIFVVAAGGIYDGRGLAMALCLTHTA